MSRGAVAHSPYATVSLFTYIDAPARSFLLSKLSFLCGDMPRYSSTKGGSSDRCRADTGSGREATARAGRERSPTHDRPLARSGDALSPNDAAINPTLCIGFSPAQPTAMKKPDVRHSPYPTSGWSRLPPAHSPYAGSSLTLCIDNGRYAL